MSLMKCRYILFSLLLFYSTINVAQQAPLRITSITGDFYSYTTYNLYEGKYIPANGMYVVTNKGVVLLDSPWDSTQCQPLLDSIMARHQQPVVMCIATHWHSDKTAGLNYFNSKGIATYTTVQTDGWSRKNNKPLASHLMANDTVFMIGQHRFETYYPGEGHTPDNIVVWFKDAQLLYGGCLIKGLDNKTLGYMGDANAAAYYSTLKNVQRRCQGVQHIVLTHSDGTTTRSLKHSLRMAKKLNK